MHVDIYNLPIQSDGDAQDQLQRTGMIAVGQLINNKVPMIIPDPYLYAGLVTHLQPLHGKYTRFVNGPLNTATGDQLIPVAAYWTMTRNRHELHAMNHIFAQNTVDIFTGKSTLPDFILLRMLPFLMRAHWALYPLAILADILLILSVLIRIHQGSLTDTDDNNTIITIAVCKAIMPTPLSLLAAKLYKRFRGAPGLVGALRDYHAARTNGNPEVAELWVPIVERF